MTALIFKLCMLWFLVTADLSSAQKAFIQDTGLKSECVGNVLKVTIDGSLVYGNHIDVEVLNGSTVVPLTYDLAAKCGYSWESDSWGNTKVYASLLSCFTHNQDDVLFDVGLRLKTYGGSEMVHKVKKTCEYKQWVSREILCERNFMEVSVHKLRPVVSVYKQLTNVQSVELFSDENPTSLNKIWRIVFHTPNEKPTTLEEAQKAGYGISTSPTRFVMRSPYHMPDLYSENVNGVEMEVFKVTTYFKWAWSITLLNTVAVCPTGGLRFTEDVITWYMPRYITPLIIRDTYELLELYVGIDGKRLNQEQMNANSYVLTLTESQIIISLPIGGPDGYYKSYVLDYVYHITYCIEPMLELLWKESNSEITRYKVHYPITTPPEPRPPHIIDNTMSELRMFDIILGTFLNDVELMNITFSTGVMSVDKAIERGFIVQQYRLSNGSKTFSLQVPFSDPVVLKSNIKHVMVYTLPLVFGLIILPDYTPFPYPALVEAIGEEIVMPTVNGFCDKKNFYVTITYGSQGKNFIIMVGKRDLSADLSKEYRVKENATHLTMTVPFLAHDIAFEFAGQSSLRGRVDISLHDSIGTWHITNFSMACTFPMTMIECFSNGSITALAVKVQSATTIVPSKLTLRDPSCKPAFSDNRFAAFSFNASSCGTTRTFKDGSVNYQNEILMSGINATNEDASELTPSEQKYSISCSYLLDDSKIVAFSTMPQRAEIIAEPGFGELHVRMRIATDSSYRDFYMEEDYPVVQYLKRPLYFEVQLVQSTDPRIELILDNCWASDAGSTVSWDLIVSGCANPGDRYQTKFHPVTPDDRVQFPSHVKRIEVRMFTFFKDNMPTRDQIFVHCEALICDVHRTDPACPKHCLPGAANTKQGMYTIPAKVKARWSIYQTLYWPDSLSRAYPTACSPGPSVTDHDNAQKHGAGTTFQDEGLVWKDSTGHTFVQIEIKC